mmetsp:Transcript_16513/g.20409  ORF Transcript_16513/g.20409 Transcript_16513/m.20409 type:complete len:93 (+) Transcript_16513:43-321(+)
MDNNSIDVSHTDDNPSNNRRPRQITPSDKSKKSDREYKKKKTKSGKRGDRERGDVMMLKGEYSSCEADYAQKVHDIDFFNEFDDDFDDDDLE